MVGSITHDGAGPGEHPVRGPEDLTVACRQVQIVGTAATCRAPSLALVAAIERALVTISIVEPRPS